LKRETRIEPATFSLGIWLKIENREHSEFRHLFKAIEFTGEFAGFSGMALNGVQMEFTGDLIPNPA
jgi:hypothetical protein